MTVRVSVQASPGDRSSWLRLAADVETAGFEALLVPDHPGSGPAPFAALAAAAAVTERIRLGTYVVNAGAWEPLALAREVATLDLLSEGRAMFGIGAGHTPVEWTSVGRDYPSPAARVDRMIELITATRALLRGGPVSHRGESFTLVDAELREPRPVQDPIPLLVGGNGTRLLRFAAEHADVVGLTGLGRTLADGHEHEVDWSPAGLRRIADLVGSVGPSTARRGLDALVQYVEITDDAEEAAERLADEVGGATVPDLLRTPFVWIGDVDEIRERIHEDEVELGIDRYTVRASAIDDVRRVLDAAT